MNYQTSRLFCLLQPSASADDSDLRFDNSCCYIPWFSVNKTRTVTGWFLVTYPWSNSNVSRPEYNCEVVARAPEFNSTWLFKGKSKYITKHLMYGPTRNKLLLFSLESWCPPGFRLGKHQGSRKNKTNCFPRDHTLSVECHAQTHPITAYYYRTKREICFLLITNLPGMLPVCYDVIYSTQFSKYQTWALFWRLSTQGKDKYGRDFVKKTSNQWRHTLADRSMVNSNPEWTISFSFAP